MRSAREEVKENKKLYLDIINLKYNTGFQEIIKQLRYEVEDMQDQLAELNDPEEVVVCHSQWKSAFSTLKFLEDFPEIYRQQYTETFGIDPELDNIVN
jgi:hypothetical protein